MVALSWLLSALVGLAPYLWEGRYQYFTGAAGVGPDGDTAQNMSFFLVTEAFALYLPTLIIVVSVGVITYKVRGRWASNYKVTATLLTVLCVYLACFTAYFIFILLNLTGLLPRLPTRAQLYTQNIAFLALAWHSGTNPVVYAFKAGQFKEEIKSLESQAVRKYLGMVMRIKNVTPGGSGGSGGSQYDRGSETQVSLNAVKLDMTKMVKVSPTQQTRESIL
eukprot:sb/3469817/